MFQNPRQDSLFTLKALVHAQEFELDSHLPYGCASHLIGVYLISVYLIRTFYRRDLTGAQLASGFFNFNLVL
jgi:hypothetical protein